MATEYYVTKNRLNYYTGKVKDYIADEVDALTDTLNDSIDSIEIEDHVKGTLTDILGDATLVMYGYVGVDENGDPVIGSAIDPTDSSPENDYKYYTISVTPGKVYKITGLSRGQVRAAIFMNSQFYPVTSGYYPLTQSTSPELMTLFIEAPVGASTLIVNGAVNTDIEIKEFQASNTGKYYRYTGITLEEAIAEHAEDLKGPKGDKGDKGDTGDSPTITASKSGKTTTVFADGTAIATIVDGNDGNNGNNGNDGHSPVVTASKSGSVTTVSVDGTPIATINDGVNGNNGNDGHTPVITASKSGTVTTISIDGTSVATINDGEDGNDGNDGHTPVITASKSGSVTTISADGTSIATINDGANGNDYVLTSADKEAIAAIVLSELPDAEGVSY